MTQINGGTLAFALIIGHLCSTSVQAATVGDMFRTPEAVIYVNTSQHIGLVNKRVLGTNVLAYQNSDPRYSAEGAGMWDSKSGSSVPHMVRLARESGATTLRWPGGCGVHEYNWKLAVGPKEMRPRQPFGLPEFLRLASDIGAEPVITLADYWGDPDDAADLVEYLNAPVGENPNGGTDWAAVRAKDGHPKPFRVVWFEYGNESAHGFHQPGKPTFVSPRRFDAKEYSRRFRSYRDSMKAIDQSIRLGAVLDDDKNTSLSHWTETVIKETGDVADFFIHHPYLPQYSANDGQPQPADLYRIALSAPRQFDAVFQRLNEFILQETGRRIPLAATEFNGHFVQETPVPYRLSLGTAVLVADMLQTLLDPRNNIVHAQYWQFANEYWGMIKGYTPVYTTRPAFHVFSLYHKHLGDELLATKVESDGYEHEGGFGVVPARGKGSRFELNGPSESLAPTWKISWTLGANAGIDANGVLGIEIATDRELNYHHARLSIPADPSMGYRVTAKIRAEGLMRRGAQLQVGDARGWRATKSASLSNMVNSREWEEVHADYVTLPDTERIDIIARRLEHLPEAGRFWLRNVRVQRFTPFTLSKVPFVGAISTRRGNKIAVFVVNRRIDGPTRARIQSPGAIGAHAWTLSGPAIDATNESEPRNVEVSELGVETSGGTLRTVLPPHSLSVIEFDLNSY